MRRSWSTGLFAAWLVGGAAVAVLAAGSGPQAPHSERAADSPGPMHARLSLLGSPQTGAQASVAREQVLRVADTASLPAGTALSAAREALTVPGGPSVLAAPGRTRGEVLALAIMPVGAGTGRSGADYVAEAGNAPGDVFDEQGIVLTLGSAPDGWVVGLVPDGVGRVTVTLAGGSVTARVRNNAFAVRESSPLRGVSLERTRAAEA